MRSRIKAAQRVRDYLHSGDLLGMLGVHSPGISSQKRGVQAMIPTKDRRQVCLEQCAVYDGIKKPGMIPTETWERCECCEKEAEYITAAHMAGHGYSCRSEAIKAGALVKVQKNFKRGA